MKEINKEITVHEHQDLRRLLVCKEHILKICAVLLLSKKFGRRRIKFEFKTKKLSAVKY
jgi:hypothetical protein